MGACTCQECGAFTQGVYCAKCQFRRLLEDMRQEIKDLSKDQKRELLVEIITAFNE